MLITSPYHAFLETSYFLDGSKRSDFEYLAHFSSALQFAYDFILAAFGLGNYCQFDIDFQEWVKNIEGLIKENETRCAQKKLYKII